MNDRVSRRAIFSIAGTLAFTSLVAACSSSTPSSSATTAPSGTGSTPASAAATAAPAAAASPASQAGTNKFRYLYNATPGVDEQVHLDLIKLYNSSIRTSLLKRFEFRMTPR